MEIKQTEWIETKCIERSTSVEDFQSELNSFLFDEWEEKFGFDLSGYVKLDKRKALRNCVDPKMGVHIFNCAFKDNEIGLFAFQQENER